MLLVILGFGFWIFCIWLFLLYTYNRSDVNANTMETYMDLNSLGYYLFNYD